MIATLFGLYSFYMFWVVATVAACSYVWKNQYILHELSKVQIALTLAVLAVVMSATTLWYTAPSRKPLASQSCAQVVSKRSGYLEHTVVTFDTSSVLIMDAWYAHGFFADSFDALEEESCYDIEIGTLHQFSVQADVLLSYDERPCTCLDEVYE